MTGQIGDDYLEALRRVNARALAGAITLRGIAQDLDTLERRVLATTAVAGATAPVALVITDGAGVPVTRLDAYDPGRGQLTGLAGQRFTFHATASPTGAALADVTWTVTGEAVRTYTQTPAAARVEPLSQQHRTGERVELCWIAAGPHTVTAHGRVNGQPVSATITCAIVAPTVESFRLETVDPHYCDSTRPYLKPGEWLALYDPTVPGGKVGCAWRVRVRAPIRPVGATRFTETGRIGFVQLVSMTATRRVAGTPGVEIMTSMVDDDDSNPANYILDDGGVLALYDIGRLLEAGRLLAVGPDDEDNPTVDSPAARLQPFMTRLRMDDRFRLYLIYKPDLPGAVWVTLRRLDWSWSATIERERPDDPNSRWAAPTELAVSPRGAPADGQPSSELPLWSRPFSSPEIRWRPATA